MRPSPSLRLVVASALCGFVFVWPVRRPAFAAPTSCTINSVSSLNFGAFDTLSDMDDDSAGNVRYSCQGGATVQIALSGLRSDKTRQMLSGADVLVFNVFQDAARSIIFGDGSNGASALTVGRVPNNAQQTTQFYGRIPGGQDVPAGAYTATLVVTVNF